MADGALANAGSNRRLEFGLGAGFAGSCGFALVLALSQKGVGSLDCHVSPAQRSVLRARQKQCPIIHLLSGSTLKKTDRPVPITFPAPIPHTVYLGKYPVHLARKPFRCSR
jgi:hypothetical protein